MNEQSLRSGNSLEFDNRQVFAAVAEANFQHQLCAGTASHQGPRFRARRTPWPLRARLESRATIGREPSEVHFVRCFATEPSVRARLVVPSRCSQEFAEKGFTSIRHKRQASEQALDRQDDSLNDGNRAVLTDSTIAWTLDTFPATPFSECVAVKLLAAIADDVLGDCSGASAARGPHPTRPFRAAAPLLWWVACGRRGNLQDLDGCGNLLTTAVYTGYVARLSVHPYGLLCGLPAMNRFPWTRLECRNSVIVHRSEIHVVGTLCVPSVRSVDSLTSRKRHTECAYYLTGRERLRNSLVIALVLLGAGWSLAGGAVAAAQVANDAGGARSRRRLRGFIRRWCEFMSWSKSRAAGAWNASEPRVAGRSSRRTAML